MSIKDRIAAKKAAMDAAAQSSGPKVSDTAGAPAHTSSPRSERGRRFSSAGVVDDVEPERDADPVAVETRRPAAASVPVQEVQAAPATTPIPVSPPQPPASRAARFAATRSAAPSSNVRPMRSTAASPDFDGPGPMDEREEPPAFENLEWTDTATPAGSGYSPQEWAAVELANPGHTVFEVLKAEDRGLVTKERDANDVVLHRSLLVHARASSQWLGHATASMEHHGEFGVQRYRIIRSQDEREKAPWADGSKLVIKDANAPQRPAEGAHSQQTSPSRRERFRG